MPDPLVKFRRVHFTDALTGVKGRCYMPSTLPKPDTTDDGESDPTQDIYLGGGSGGSSPVFYPFKVYLSPIIAPLPGTATLGSTNLTLTTSDAGVIAQIAAAIADAVDGPTTITGTGIASGTTLVSITGSVNPVVVLSNPTTAVVNSAVTISPPNAWRSVRVRAGCVGVVDVLDTDGDGLDSEGRSPNYDPDTFGIPPYAPGIDFLVGKAYLTGVWIDATDSANPTIAHGYIGDDWNPDQTRTPGGPAVWSEIYILVAVIDATDPEDTFTAVVRQFQRTDCEPMDSPVWL
jgi:hypothetical protein